MTLSWRKAWLFVFLCAAPALAVKGNVPSSGVLVGREALAFLIKAGSDKNSEVRSAVASAWGKIGNPAAIPILKKMLKDREPSVRLAAANSLYSVGDKASFKIILDIAALPPKTPDNPTPIERLKLMAKETLRVNAIKELCAIGKLDHDLGEKAVEVFEKTLNDPAGRVQDATAAALAAMGLDEFVSRFLDAAKSQDPAVREAAVGALGQIETAESLSALTAAASDSSSDVRSEAMEAIANFPAANSVPILDKGLKDSDPDVRAKALESLSKLNDQQSVAALSLIFQSPPDLSTQMIAMAGLLRRGQALDASTALPALKSSDEDIRRLGIQVMGLCTDDQSLSWLREEMKKDGSMLLRVAAAQTAIMRLESKHGENP